MSHLILSSDEGGFRCLLDGESLHAGDMLEVKLASKAWLPVRFETDQRHPVFYLGIDGSEDQAKLILPPDASLRLPSE